MISKVIAKRLKTLLPAIISQEQLSYVEGKQILDSILTAHEDIHSLSTSKKTGMIIKLDM